ncbi:F-box and JmjC domain-containing protein [Rhizoctonia solani AG-1 IA]|uniref:F-box and JmjC domain-containing protein n=1 Tax=Thanatephorus cucumeris (strain AG1-IA) TaxID=983506 RepID=L8X0Q2_THACA|nr:F-box and JmjC domain-containing protein [Rhizoctonia solani AG-1 IA]
MAVTQITSTSIKRHISPLDTSYALNAAHTKRLRRDNVANEDIQSKPSSFSHSGIKPSGNLLFNHSLSIRRRGLGNFDVLSDSLILGIIGLLDARDILLLGSCSKASFAYCAHQPIWKDLYIRTANGRLDGWAGTWRKTYLQEFTSTGTPRKGGDRCMRLTPTIDCTGLFSDELYQPYLCANTDLNRYFYPRNNRDAVSRLNMTRIEAKSIGNEFASSSSEPFVVTNALEHLGWPAFCSVDSEGKPLWDTSNLLKKYSDISFRAEAFDCTLRTYWTYAENCPEDDAPLYLFDSRFVEKTEMGADYTPPSFLSEDLFQLMGDKRPDYRWLIVGPAKSGSTFHKDPNATSAWNAVITGSKDVLPPGVYVSSDEAEVTSPLSLAAHRCILILCRPSGWWHLVVNLEPSVAVTQNFASEHELVNVLRFMRDKPDQTSGWAEDIACADLYEIFCDVLRKERPENLENALAVLNKGSRKGNGEQQSVWEQLKKPTLSEGVDSGFSFGFEVEGSNDDEE